MLDLKMAGADGGMDGWQFAASLINSVAWPLAAVGIALIFHTQIGNLLRNVSSISWGDKSINFRDLLTKVEEDQPVLPLAPPMPHGTASFTAALGVSAAAGIIEAWEQVNTKLMEIYQALHAAGEGYPYWMVPMQMLPDDLLARNVINRTQHKLIASLFELREAAMRENAQNTANLTDADAIRFYNLAEKLIQSLNLIELPAPN